jgi:hypothetical protein
MAGGGDVGAGAASLNGHGDDFGRGAGGGGCQWRRQRPQGETMLVEELGIGKWGSGAARVGADSRSNRSVRQIGRAMVSVRYFSRQARWCRLRPCGFGCFFWDCAFGVSRW